MMSSQVEHIRCGSCSLLLLKPAFHTTDDMPMNHCHRWTKQQLQGLVYTATCKDRQPCTIMSTAWGATFLRHCCWHTILPISIKSLEVRELLQIYEQHMTAATAHPQAFGRMCGMLAAVGACGHSASVLDMVGMQAVCELQHGSPVCIWHQGSRQDAAASVDVVPWMYFIALCLHLHLSAC